MRVKLTTDRGATDYKRFAQTRCKERYEIVGAPPIARAGLLELYPHLKLPFLKPLASTADLQEVYYPLEDAPGISRKFAQLRTVEDVLQFANTYGLLGLEEVRRFEGHREEILKVGEGVNLWLGEAAQFARLYSVWDSVNSRCSWHPARAATNCRGCASVSERELRKIIKWQRPNFVTVRFPDAEHVIASNAQNTSWFGKWKVGEVLGPAKLYLIEQYNTNMFGSASPILLLNAKGEMRPHISTTS